MFVLRAVRGVSRCLTSVRGVATASKEIPSEPAWPDSAPVYKRCALWPDSIALKDNFSCYTYGSLYASARQLAAKIRGEIGGKEGERILFLCPNDVNYVVTLWAIWMSNNTAVPLSPLHPRVLLEYYSTDCDAGLMISTADYEELLAPVARHSSRRLLVLGSGEVRSQATAPAGGHAAPCDEGEQKRAAALVLYTSGSTGAPKGAVITHGNLMAQTNSLVEAWKWSREDSILHALPLHHLHGIVNALLCPLAVGARCHMMERFDPHSAWAKLLAVNQPIADRINVFMGLPKNYAALIREYQRLFADDKKMVEYIRGVMGARFRLMVSGSAPLPLAVADKWREITTQSILERFGMIETGMVLSQPYGGTRSPGFVGVPLPGVSVQLQDHGNCDVLLECQTDECGRVRLKTPAQSSSSSPTIRGDLLVKGAGVISEYFNRPEDTRRQFRSDWFITGDTAEYHSRLGQFRLLGQTAVDMIQVAGCRVSALEVEAVFAQHPSLEECAVLGRPDPVDGNKLLLVAVVKEAVFKETAAKDTTLKETAVEETAVKDAASKEAAGALGIDQLRAWAKDRLPAHQLPVALHLVPALPRNTMGKINKLELAKQLLASKSAM